jgi:transcriptional regulator with XRE-family HTH domain
MDSINQYVINKAKALRIKKKLTLYQWGIILGKTASFIGNVEQPRNPAKYNLGHLKTLAEFFNISPRYFLPETIAELEQEDK